MLSEISQAHKDKYCMISYLESKKVKRREQERSVVPEDQEVREIRDTGGKTQAFIYQMIKFWRADVPRDDYS